MSAHQSRERCLVPRGDEAREQLPVRRDALGWPEDAAEMREDLVELGRHARALASLPYSWVSVGPRVDDFEIFSA